METTSTKGVSIWLDDTRESPPGYVWVRSVNELKRAIDQAKTVALVSLDHDLTTFTGDGGDGRDAARHILMLATGGHPFFTCRIHSNNSDHGYSMQAVLRDAYRVWSKFEPVYWVEGDSISPTKKLDW